MSSSSVPSISSGLSVSAAVVSVSAAVPPVGVQSVSLSSAPASAPVVCTHCCGGHSLFSPIHPSMPTSVSFAELPVVPVPIVATPTVVSAVVPASSTPTPAAVPSTQSVFSDPATEPTNKWLNTAKQAPTSGNSVVQSRGLLPSTGPVRTTKKKNNRGPPRSSSDANETAADKSDKSDKPRVRTQRAPCEACIEITKAGGDKLCLLCQHHGREATGHCVDCCNYCAGCQRPGHQLYRDDGTIMCFKELAKSQVCDICGEKGHLEERCRRDWCKTCRTDGKGHNFVGHTVERCRKHHVCETCGNLGHYPDRCRPKLTCEKCNRDGHSTEKCDRDIECAICLTIGHSASRCRACKYCGHSNTNKKGEHICKRDLVDNSCLNCGGTSKLEFPGKCACYDHQVRRPRQNYGH